jgi:nuclear transport factor 2 (NTF2) superfamily protein
MTTSPSQTPAAVNAPPFTRESALLKVRAVEDTWNFRDPDRVALAYTKDSVWRNRSVFLVGRDRIRQFPAGKFARRDTR